MSKNSMPIVHPSYSDGQPETRQYHIKKYDTEWSITEEIYDNHHRFFLSERAHDSLVLYRRKPAEKRGFKTFLDEDILADRRPLNLINLYFKGPAKGLKERRKFKLNILLREGDSAPVAMGMEYVRKFKPFSAYNKTLSLRNSYVANYALVVRRHCFVLYKPSLMDGKPYLVEAARIPRYKDVEEDIKSIRQKIPAIVSLLERRNFIETKDLPKTRELEDPRRNA